MLQLEYNAMDVTSVLSSVCRKSSFSLERMTGTWDGRLALLNYFTLGLIQLSLGDKRSSSCFQPEET